LQLSRLRARGQLAELRGHDLRFTSDEINTYFRLVVGHDLSRAAVRVVERRTEGWAAGLQLLALSLRRLDGPPDENALLARAAGFSGSQRHIFAYMADEVFGLQPPDLQRFLLETSC